MKTFVFNGFAAADDLWSACVFPRERIFSYLELLDGASERTLAETDRAVLVGFSMGGTFALKAFLDHPEKIAGLVLVSATPCLGEDRATDWRGMSPRRREALLLGTRFAHPDDPSPLYAEANLARGIRFLADTDLRAGLRAARDAGLAASLPVALFQSAADYIVRPHNVDFLRDVFPGAAVTVVPGREHNLPCVCGAAIAAAVGRVNMLQCEKIKRGSLP